jgi:hypothetical protein
MASSSSSSSSSPSSPTDPSSPSDPSSPPPQNGGGKTGAMQTAGQDFGSTGCGTTGSLHLNFNTTPRVGDTIRVAIWGGAPSGPSNITQVSDGGDTFNLMSQPLPPTSPNQFWLYQATNIAHPPLIITIVPATSCTNADWSAAAIDYSPTNVVMNTGVVDTAESQTGTIAANADTFSMTPIVTHTPDVVIAIAHADSSCDSNGMIAAGNGWNVEWISQSQNVAVDGGPTWCVAVEDQLAATPGSVTPTFFVTPQMQSSGFEASVAATQ